jgi:acetyltransferase-like isoleucine patch superfamily enzyme
MPPEHAGARVVPATHGRQPAQPDPAFEALFAEDLAARCSRDDVLHLFRRFSREDGHIDRLLRRVGLRALAKSCGRQLSVGINVSVKHPETFTLGDGVVIGDGVIIHGRHDGYCRIGNMTWIGPQSFLDARSLVIGDYVGWGPGAKVLGSQHTGEPTDIPIIVTDLAIEPVQVDDWADIGTNAVLLPGVSVGRGAIVGAGAVVTKNVPPFAKVAGVPARIIGWRYDSTDHTPAPDRPLDQTFAGGSSDCLP